MLDNLNSYSVGFNSGVSIAGSKPMDIHFTDVKYFVKTGKFNKGRKIILKNVSGTFKSGELTAIMGPSGAGKSSLLNILTGFQREGVEGVIYTSMAKKMSYGPDMNLSNEHVVVTNRRVHRDNSCYIMQDDHLSPLFTVHEIMTISANFKLGNCISKLMKQAMIEDILNRLGLSSVMYNKCGVLSGGQKKRLSIALELIDNPPIMFLDEPTTGLDSRSSNMCVSILKKLAKGGRTVVCTIHQPSATIFEMFDHVYVIAEGHCVYQGSCQNIVPFLRTVGLNCPQYHNPADFVMEVLSNEYGNFTSQLISMSKSTCWRSSESKSQQFYQIQSSDSGKLQKSIIFKKPSELYRFFMLLDRCIVKLYRDWTVSHLKIILHFFVGVLLGLLYSRCGVDGSKSFYNVGFLIVSLVYLSYTSLMPAVLKFPDELHIIRKEEFNNWYKLPTFYAAFLVANIPTQMMFCFVYCAMSYYLSSQILVWSRFVMFLVVCQLMTLISEGFGLILGTCLSPTNGVFVGAVMTCFFILFAGYVVLFSHMPRILYYFSYISYFRYAFEGLVTAIYGGGREPLECSGTSYCYYRFPEAIFGELSMKEERYYTDVLALMVFLITFITVSFFSLRRRIRSLS